MSNNDKRKPRKRATAQERDERFDLIAKMEVIGLSPRQIRQTLQKQYGIGKRQTDYDRKEVRKRMEVELDEQSEERVALSVRRYEYLLSRAYADKDWPEARKLLNDSQNLELKWRKNGRGHSKAQSVDISAFVEETLAKLEKEAVEAGTEGSDRDDGRGGP